MTLGQRLACLTPAWPPVFSIESIHVPLPSHGEVVVRVEASAVNPIDAKRASGYGRRLLGLKGAGKFPLVLGNDLAGRVESVGKGVTAWRPGDRVMGLLPTGKGGTYATHVAVDARWLRQAVNGYDPRQLSVFPYTFTTLWQSLRTAGISERNAKGLEILVYGASGGLGQLALQVLAHWGASVTAICSTANIELCRSLGATVVWDRTRRPLSELPYQYDAVLNFGAWQDEEVLIGRLKAGAIGYATTVHPLLSNFDSEGWLLGAWRTLRDLRRTKAMVADKGARYGWVVFKPEEEALDALTRMLSENALALPVGAAVPLSDAKLAFEHVAGQRSGRAVLLP